MRYLDLDIIKKQCRIEPDFTEDDELLELYGDAAEDYTEQHIDYQLDTIAAENSGELPTSIMNALLIFVDYMYGSSGSGDVKEVPNVYWILLNPFKKYFVE